MRKLFFLVGEADLRGVRKKKNGEGGRGVGRFMLRKEEGSVWLEVILCDV